MIQGYESIAFNTAPDSENQIHSDDMAQRFGFQGGLVPGVAVSAYLIQPAVEAGETPTIIKALRTFKSANPPITTNRFGWRSRPLATVSLSPSC